MNTSIFVLLRLWHDEFSMTKSVALPKDDLRTDLTVREHSSLETCNQASVGHHTDWQLKRSNRFFRDRENNLVVGSCGTLHYEKVFLNISGEALSASIYRIVNSESQTVFAPRDNRFWNRLILWLAGLFIVESQVTIVNIGLETSLEFW